MNGRLARDLRKNFGKPTRAYGLGSGEYRCETTHNTDDVKNGKPCEKCGAVK